MAVSGCTRECAEAQSKDVGVIATENGWNLFLAGNGGARPQHGVLFATDLDTETLVRTIDRYLMFYVRTAGRLERTAPWFNKLDGGVEHLRDVIVDDALGICDELDAEMARHVAEYRCEWKEAISSPDVVARFRTFVNSDEPDPTVVFVRERGQIRPARAEEKATIA
jgi:nitrite reductase (NADH) large subunit